MSCVSSNLIAHALGWRNGDGIDNALVRVEVKRKASVVLLNDRPSGLFHSLCADTLYRRDTKDEKEPEDAPVECTSTARFANPWSKR